MLDKPTKEVSADALKINDVIKGWISPETSSVNFLDGSFVKEIGADSVVIGNLMGYHRDICVGLNTRFFVEVPEPEFQKMYQEDAVSILHALKNPMRELRGKFDYGVWFSRDLFRTAREVNVSGMTILGVVRNVAEKVKDLNTNGADAAVCWKDAAYKGEYWSLVKSEDIDYILSHYKITPGGKVCPVE